MSDQKEPKEAESSQTLFLIGMVALVLMLLFTVTGPLWLSS